MCGRTSQTLRRGWVRRTTGYCPDVTPLWAHNTIQLRMFLGNSIGTQFKSIMSSLEFYDGKLRLVRLTFCWKYQYYSLILHCRYRYICKQFTVYLYTWSKYPSANCNLTQSIPTYQRTDSTSFTGKTFIETLLRPSHYTCRYQDARLWWVIVLLMQITLDTRRT